MTNSLTLFAVSTMLVRSIWSLAVNTTTIEGWEIDRHHALLRRARTMGGFVYGPDGTKVLIRRQEFPYDVGIWRNITQGMGTANVGSCRWFDLYKSTFSPSLSPSSSSSLPTPPPPFSPPTNSATSVSSIATTMTISPRCHHHHHHLLPFIMNLLQVLHHIIS